jgi:hypothetical protein
MSPQTPQDYRDRADACDQLAARATSHDVRMTMRYVASTWRELADAEEAKREPLTDRRPPHAPK